MTYRNSYNEILIQIYALLKGMTFSDVAKYSMTRSIAPSLCDS